MIEEHTETNTVYYIREPGGELIARVHPTEGIRYYHFDELGSTRLLTDANGTVTDRYAYDAYGSLLSHDRYSGSVNQPYQYVGRLGYYTHWMEPEFGLLQLGVRFYDAQVGRFTQRDQVHTDSASSALYCAGDPLGGVDPSGLILVSLAKCLCMYEVWTWYNAHRDDPEWFPSDKVAHCWFTCNMVKRCHIGLRTTVKLSVAKECWDCVDQQNPGTTGFEDVELGDLIADADGMLIGRLRGDCWHDCMDLWRTGNRTPQKPPRYVPAPIPPIRPPVQPLPLP